MLNLTQAERDYWSKEATKHERMAASLQQRYRASRDPRWHKQAVSNARRATQIRNTLAAQSTTQPETAMKTIQSQAAAQAARQFAVDLGTLQKKSPEVLIDTLAKAEAKLPATERFDVRRLAERVGTRAVWVRFNDGQKQPVTFKVQANHELTWAEIMLGFVRGAYGRDLGNRKVFKGMHYVGRGDDGQPIYFAYLGRS